MNSKVIKPFVRMLISDTGGGHRACAEALEAALGDRVTTDIIDLMVNSGTPGIERMPAIYAWLEEHPKIWGVLWYLLDGPVRCKALSDPAWLAARRRYKELITEGNPDLVIVLHPYLTTGAMRALRDQHTQLAVVVTDPVTPHAAWFGSRLSRTYVSTRTARQRALACGIDASNIRIAGHPVHPRVMRLAGHREALREKYGWNNRTVLLTGGADATGLMALVEAAQPACDRLVVICGRNESLYRKLTTRNDLEALGFVADLPERMCAADVVVTKAGPSTLAECEAVGTPVIISSYMPGQETGNIRWITERGLGSVALKPAKLRSELRYWLNNAERCQHLRNTATSVVNEAVSLQLADELLALISDSKPV